MVRRRSTAGSACIADIATFAERPYGTVLLHRPAAILPAADLESGLRSAGEKAARQATEAGACAADLSSLHLLGLLENDRLRIRSALTSLTVASSPIVDALLTRDHVRNLSATTYTASLAPEGTIDRTTITTTERDLLRAHAEALENIAASAHERRPTALPGPRATPSPSPGRTSFPCGATHRPAAEGPHRGAEEPDDAQIASDQISRDVMEEGIRLVAVTSLPRWGLALHHSTTDSDAIMQVLADRYRFWDDDIAHPDPFHGRLAAENLPGRGSSSWRRQSAGAATPISFVALLGTVVDRP